MLVINQQSIVKTVGNITLQFYIVSRSFSSSDCDKADWNGELEDLFLQIVRKVHEVIESGVSRNRQLVVVSFDQELQDEEFFEISKIHYRITRAHNFISLISPLNGGYKTRTGKVLDNAQVLIQNLFQSYRSMGKMIQNDTKFSNESMADIDKDYLIELVLQLIELQGFQLNEEEIMQVVMDFRSLKEIANTMIKNSD